MSRDAELYKDKIEVSLDGRQIFYLFFGGAVIVGLVFVLGVMIGRRVEARGHVDRTHTDVTEDPLAALDRLDSGAPNLTKQLLAPAPAAPVQEPVDKKIEQIAAAEAAKHAAPAPVPAVVPAAPAVAENKPKHEDAKHDDAKHDDAKHDDAKHDEAKHDDAKRDDAKHDDAKRDDAKHDDAKRDDAKHDDDAKKTAPKDADDSHPEHKVRYTLQLSSFHDRGEAQSFLDDLKTAGFEATLSEATVDGKTFYRVRLGSYKTLEAANDAKAELEKSAKKSAQVMRL